MSSKLPVVYDLLGRLYSHAEWEALCKGCGLCCYVNHLTDTGWVSTGVPCRYLDVVDRTCRVYPQRFDAEPECTKVTPSVVHSGMMPPDCGYNDELQRIVEEDYDGRDPRSRSARDRKRRRRRSRRRR